jgi:hypothetical protein
MEKYRAWLLVVSTVGSMLGQGVHRKKNACLDRSQANGKGPGNTSVRTKFTVQIYLLICWLFRTSVFYQDGSLFLEGDG